MFSDHGHARGQNKGPDGTFRNAQRHKWFDYYVKGTGPAPFHGVQTLTQTCGGPSGGATGPFDNADTDQPFQAATWRALAPGEVRHSAPPRRRSIPLRPTRTARRSTRSVAAAPARRRLGADQTGMANYRLDPAPAGGYTLMGSPTIVADINSLGPHSQIAARLLDIVAHRRRDARRARPLPAGDQPEHDADTPGLPAPPERLEVRQRVTSRSSSCCRTTARTAVTRTASFR